ncbi:lysophospholipid acyltransferase family protein [Acidipila sp. EB88]|uniref:lysophospholipid acyltransferase family protein n=1 Tax=Acidipila sp. EB88 TaxID=2305226 RepID=UPI000F5E1A61|nr:lysophospholipid acyltransferase family protein [Acidipila sp. EB88]RRA47911.1 hypothetical protein D1Y84_06000 [Acidipila sp. EB88]
MSDRTRLEPFATEAVANGVAASSTPAAFAPIEPTDSPTVATSCSAFVPSDAGAFDTPTHSAQLCTPAPVSGTSTVTDTAISSFLPRPSPATMRSGSTGASSLRAPFSAPPAIIASAPSILVAPDPSAHTAAPLFTGIAQSTGQSKVQSRAPRSSAATLERPSRALLRCFDTYLHFFIGRHFHALRLAGAEHWPALNRRQDASHDAPRGPLLICLNHPSWWDPLTSIVLSRFLERQSDHYAPMDARAFSRYGIFRKLGLFPVEQDTPRGAAQFLRGAARIFADPGAVLWLTPQGHFTDTRARPIQFRAGLDALLRRTPDVTVLPLALEYTFWDERLPEALALLGKPLHFHHGQLAVADRDQAQSPRDSEPSATQPTRLTTETAACQNATNAGTVTAAGEHVALALAHTLDTLAAIAARRNPAEFHTVLSGSSGTSGIYGAWQRFRAFTRGEHFEPGHGALQHNQSRDPFRRGANMQVSQCNRSVGDPHA